jgi:transcriptional regulator with XRE-family HTH domain
MSQHNRAAERLTTFRTLLGLSIREAARQLGVTHTTLIQWEGGVCVPGPENREAIERWTRRAVRASSWPGRGYQAKRRLEVPRVRPAVGAAE